MTHGAATPEAKATGQKAGGAKQDRRFEDKCGNAIRKLGP